MKHSTMGTQLLSAPDTLTPQALAVALEPNVRLCCERPTSHRITFLDTFDWRLWNRGARLVLERTRGALALRYTAADGEAPHVVPVATPPRYTADLPDGPIRCELREVVEMRALLPVGAARLDRQLLRAVDGDGNTTVRLWWEAITPVDGRGRVAGERLVRLRLEDMTGRGGAGKKVRRILASLPGPSPDGADELEPATAVRGRRPGDYSSKLQLSLEAGERADEAVRRILRHLLATLRANVPGVRDDTDSEFLHDLRVATRRTRSALAQLEGLFPGEEIDAFVDGFRWLGTLTGPCRDLDVFLLEMEGYRQLLPADVAAELAPLAEHLTEARERAHQDVVKGLRSRRFRALLDAWEGYLRRPPSRQSDPPNASRAIVDLANERILRAYRRTVKRGLRLVGPDPPAETLHRLRIDAKKLRYLLEFFRGLSPGPRIEPLIKELKSLQDILGGFNDMEIQRQRLLDFARDMVDAGVNRPETLFAMGRLAAALEQRQEEFRCSFESRFAPFASDASQAEYRALFGPRPGGASS